MVGEAISFGDTFRVDVELESVGHFAVAVRRERLGATAPSSCGEKAADVMGWTTIAIEVGDGPPKLSDS